MDKSKWPTTVSEVWRVISPGASVAPGSLQTGAEIVPGYRLVVQLGGGTFGDVWKAIGPGEVSVALKILRFGAGRAAREARALEFMKYVTHPHLVTIFGIWHRADLLIVGMELAQKTLLDRLREVIREGQSGIPSHELSEYMREAAKGIDFLSEPRHTIAGKPSHSIVHRDIKPANLLLVGGGVKVADFGLASAIDRSIATTTACMTPSYAAPEFFQGLVSRHSDQYSLAVTYYHLRTGCLPFQGNPLQIMAGHLEHAPDLSLLAPAERATVAKAMAKRMEDRWPSCGSFIENLRQSPAERGSARRAPDLTVEEGILESRHREPGLAVLRSLAKFTDRMRPLVVIEASDVTGERCYSVRDRGPAREGTQHPILLGSRVFWSLLFEQEGHLLLLDEDPDGKVFCLCPSWFVPDARVRAGRTLLPPEEAGCGPFVLTGIPGREHLVAIMTNESLELNWMPADKKMPARVLNRSDIENLLAKLQCLQPGSWTALTTYIDVVV